MKTALSTYADEVKKNVPERDEDVRVTVSHLLKIYEQKTNNKIAKILQSLPRQDIIVLHAAVLVFGDVSGDKGVKLMQLYEETEMECDVRESPKIDMRQFLNCIDELEYYNLMSVDRSSNKKEHKLFVLHLNCDIADLKRDLDAMVPKDE